MLQLTEYDTEDALIASIRGEFTGNDKTFTGEAYHSLIEGDFSSEQNHFLAGKILFTPEQARPAFDYKKAHQAMIHEVPVRKIYAIHGQEVVISGRVDGIEGSQVRDIKAKFRAIDSEEYMDSIQWQFYLDILSRKVFHYDVFEVIGFDALTGPAPHKLDGVLFRPHETTTCLAYPGMHEKCHSLIVDFFDYIEDRKLFPFLKTETPSTQKQTA